MTRWEIEVVAKYYKNTCDFDETRVHNDYSVIGSEFCNFLATIITFRLTLLLMNLIDVQINTLKNAKSTI